MKAVYFERFGVSNVEFREVENPTPKDGEVLIRVISATLNPIDFFTVEGRRKVNPMPHIPGVEIFGEVAEGEHRGKKVVVYPRIFCGDCEYCVSGMEMLCTLELFGVSTNGGFAEYVVAPEKNLFFIKDEVSPELASSLPVGALTAYHAVSFVEPGTSVAIFGATGHTGMFAVQFAKLRGCEVFAITRKKSKWLYDFGADEVMTPEEAADKLKRRCHAVIDPLGSQTFPYSIETVRKGGKFITFGILTGEKVELSIFDVYTNQISVIGVTGGSRKEFFEVIKMAERGLIKSKVWRRFHFRKIKDAFEEIVNHAREGKILLHF